MGKTEFGMWANELALGSAAVTVMFGILAVAGMFHNWQFGAYGIAAGVLVFLLEYPRGKRKTGTTIERPFQRIFARGYSHFGVITRNYFIRFILYLILSVPCVFCLPTLMGGMFFIITSAIYFVAALRGEMWQPAGLDGPPEGQDRGPKVINPPNHPPPRRPPPHPDNRL